MYIRRYFSSKGLANTAQDSHLSPKISINQFGIDKQRQMSMQGSPNGRSHSLVQFLAGLWYFSKPLQALIVDMLARDFGEFIHKLG